MTRGKNSGRGAEPPADAPKVAALSLRGRDILLTNGKYTIGRDGTCQVVLDDPRVSRRHAQIEVDDGEVTITDLGSVNGIGINGKRLPDGRHQLKHGDVIGIGREELRLKITDRPPARTHSDRPTMAEDQPKNMPALVARQQFEEEPPTSTQLQPGVDLVFDVAEKALRAGDVQEAENVSADFLRNALVAATEGREAVPGTYPLATTFALRLARATGKGEWFDYVIDMLRVRRVPCSEDLGRRLERVMEMVDKVDVARLERYQDALRSGTASMESLHAATTVGELIRLALRKQ